MLSICKVVHLNPTPNTHSSFQISQLAGSAPISAFLKLLLTLEIRKSAVQETSMEVFNQFTMRHKYIILYCTLQVAL